MADIETLTRDSSLLDTRYVLQIARESGPDVRPMLLCLDGDDQFSAMVKSYEALRGAKAVPAIDLVGLGYGASYRKAGNRRVRDYTPTAMPGEYGAGGGPRFLKWIEQDLLLWLSAEHGLGRGERGIAGHSLGSLFGLYAFFSEGRPFQACLASAPSIWYHDRQILEQILHHRLKHERWPGRLVLSVGTDDSPSMNGDLKLLEDQLAAEPFLDLEVISQRYPGFDHYNVVAESFRGGLSALWPKVLA